MRHALTVAALLLAALPALAQQAPRIDPRVAGETVAALQAMLALRDAQLKAVADDAEKRIAELETLCGEPCKPKAEPPAK